MFNPLHIFSCRAAAEAASLKRDAKLPLGNRITLAMHLAICSMCRCMNNQFAIIEAALRKLSRTPEPDNSSQSLSAQARERLKSRLK
ncbi:MAG: hypothetical protein HKL96_12670 [Phycisphaerales bacterium]|nr:hypothetical protein [Phycisphaerales bacterium]